MPFLKRIDIDQRVAIACGPVGLAMCFFLPKALGMLPIASLCSQDGGLQLLFIRSCRSSPLNR